MGRPLIVLGDKTSHGGTVIGADFTFDVHGKYVARIGDMTVCPKCKGQFPITSAASDFSDGAGNGYARHLDATACGARLLSSQAVTTWSAESSPGEPAHALVDTAPALAAPTTSGICLDCLMQAAATGSSIVVRE